MPKGDKNTFKADLEDGSTPIPNLLLEAVAIARLTSKERAAVLFVIRCTFGWTDGNGGRLKEAVIPLSVWAKVLQVNDTGRVSKIISSLENKNVIKRYSLGPGKSYKYSTNIDIATWDNCIDFQVLPQITTLVLPKKSKVALSESTIVSETNSRMLNKDKRNIKENRFPDRTNNRNHRSRDTDPDKYIKGSYGHMVRH